MARFNRHAALALTTALGLVTLTGCSSQGAPRADVSASKAQTALQRGDSDKAIVSAEAAVLAEPRNAAYRAVLGASYLNVGRFDSAATSFSDAMKLGDSSARTALGFALAAIGKGDNRSALAVLEDWRDRIPAADLGLALALAGQPDRGVQILGNALRGGENTPKLRQNLAYAYSLTGNWKAARVMAAEDLAGSALDNRLGEWAQMARPNDYQRRVAGLLNVPVRADSGQPAQLALDASAEAQQLAAVAADPGPFASATEGQLARAPETVRELPPIDTVAVAGGQARPAPQIAVAAAPARAPESFADAFEAKPDVPIGTAIAEFASSALKFISSPIVQSAPERSSAAPRPASERVVARKLDADGSHLIQLGSFTSDAGARRAWGIYSQKYPELANYRMVITEAKVRGKTYFRVSAGGFESASARDMCGKVKARGQGCIAWADGRPLPGAVDKGYRLARR